MCVHSNFYLVEMWSVLLLRHFGSIRPQQLLVVQGINRMLMVLLFIDYVMYLWYCASHTFTETIYRVLVCFCIMYISIKKYMIYFVFLVNLSTIICR